MNRIAKLVMAAAVAAAAAGSAKSEEQTDARFNEGIFKDFNAGISCNMTLKDAQGNRYTGVHNVSVLIYSPGAAKALWGREFENVDLGANGIFCAMVSDETGKDIQSALYQYIGTAIMRHGGSQVFDVGFKVDKVETALSERQRLVNIPCAVFARDGHYAGGDFAVKGEATILGSVKVNSDVTVGKELKVGQGAFTAGGRLDIDGSLSSNSSLKLSDTSHSFTGAGAAPIGGIVIWSGTKETIPPGWALCDGDNGTPDLRDRFVVGYSGTGDYSEIGSTGGATNVLLAAENLPLHSHPYIDKLSAMTNGSSDWMASGSAFDESTDFPTSISKVDGKRTTDEESYEVKPHENLPPYYALAFIMRVR